MPDMAKKKKQSGKHQAERRPVQLHLDWFNVAKKRAVADRPVALVYYLIELIKKDAEAAGMKDLPPVPWEVPEG